MGFDPANIHAITEPSFEELNAKKEEIFKDCRKRSDEGQQVFVFVYFSGHGESSNEQFVCLNRWNENDRLAETYGYRYPLETRIRSKIGGKKISVCLVYDCCRTPIKETFVSEEAFKQKQEEARLLAEAKAEAARRKAEGEEVKNVPEEE